MKVKKLSKTQIKKELQRSINEFERLSCMFWACKGSYKNKLEIMVTCRKCWAVANLRKLRNSI